MCANDGHHKAHTSHFPHYLPSPTHTETVSLSARKLIWFNSKGKPATDEKTVSREKAKLCKILHRLQIWGEKTHGRKKESNGEGECVDYDRYEKWAAGWAITDQTFWCGITVRTCACICLYRCVCRCVRVGCLYHYTVSIWSHLATLLGHRVILVPVPL